MKKYLIFTLILVTIFSLSFSKGITVSTNAFFTVDPILMQQNLYQKFYVDMYLANDLGIKYSGYTDSGNLSTQEAYLFLDNFFGLNAKFGVFKDYTALTRKLHYIQVGGIPYSTYGKRNDITHILDYYAAKLSYDLGNFLSVGGIYVKNDGYGSSDLKYLYAQGSLGFLKAGAYYSSKEYINHTNYYDMVSGDANLKLGPLSIWGGVDGITKTFDTSNLTYLVGGEFKLGNLGFIKDVKVAGQYEKGPLVQLILPDFQKYGTMRVDTNLSFRLKDLMTNLYYDFTDNNDSDHGLEYGVSVGYKNLTLTYTNYDQLNDRYMNDVTGVNKFTLELVFKTRFDLLSSPVFNIGSRPKRPHALKSKKENGPRDDGSYPISYALDKLMGKDDVILEGIVTVAPGTFSRGQYTYIQDDSGMGILVYGRGKKLKVGQKVMFVGRLENFHGTPELKINGADSVQVIGKGKPTIYNIKTSEVQSYLSNLVKISGTIVREGRNVFIKDSSGRVKIYIKKPTGIDWNIFKGGERGFIIGVVSQYKGEYEILPRSNNDVNIK
jgi:DNA/RNA endonuclease YhcR with UshA esterase domain